VYKYPGIVEISATCRQTIDQDLRFAYHARVAKMVVDKPGRTPTMSRLPASSFARLPEPPYYIVAFSSCRTEGDNGYDRMADAMVELAGQQPGFLGVESARGIDGFGITNSYWQDEDSIRAWKAVVSHAAAQKLGRERWYEDYQVRIARVERAYGFAK
jgi:heme-degrading monooxygenase HmoA